MSDSFVYRLRRAVKNQTVFTLAILGSLLLFHLSLSAQTTASTGSIQGTVTDPSGALVGGAKVTINNKSTGRLITVTTTSAGAYTSGALTPGDYTIRIEAPGFKTTEIPVTVQVGVTASGNARLQVGQASQVVEVQGSAIEVNTEQATIQGVLTTQQIENLPINGRNFLDLAQLEPGVQIQDGGNFDPTKNGFSSISFGGRFGRTARIEVDGLDISDETVGTTTQNVPEGAIQEFQVQQSSLDHLHRIDFLRLRKRHHQVRNQCRTTARATTTSAISPSTRIFPAAAAIIFSETNSAANLGGPIIQDKLFFFLDAERTKQDLLDPVIAQRPVSSPHRKFRFPLSRSRRRRRSSIGRSTTITSSSTVFPTTRIIVCWRSFLTPFSLSPTSTTLPCTLLDWTLTPAALPTAFVSVTPSSATALSMRLRDRRSSIPLPGIELAIGSDPDCLTPGADFFCSGPSFLAPQQTYQSDHQFKYDGSKAVGKHILRYGGGLNHIFGGGFASFLALGPAVSANVGDCVPSPTLPFPDGCNNPLNYPANTVHLGNGQGYDSEIPAFGFPAGGSGPDNRLSFYFGDAWKIKPGLTLTYGLRYVRDTGRTDADLGRHSAACNQNFDNQY